MSVNREQLDKPTFKRAKSRRRWSYSEEKAAFNRALRREAKRDPENAPRNRQVHGWYWSLLLCLLVAGCVRVPVAPSPEPDVPVVEAAVDADITHGAYRSLMLIHARIHREAAAKARAGEIRSQADESAFLDPRMKDSRAAAFAPILKAEQAALGDGKWTPAAMADFRDKLADALEQGAAL